MIQILHKTLQLQVSLKDFAAQFPIKRFILVPRYNQLIEIYIIVSLNNRPFLNRVQNELSLKQRVTAPSYIFTLNLYGPIIISVETKLLYMDYFVSFFFYSKTSTAVPKREILICTSMDTRPLFRRLPIVLQWSAKQSIKQ